MPVRESVPQSAPGRADEGPPPSFHVGDWRVEPTRNLIVSKQRRRRLEPRVMAVLVSLASRPGEVVPRDRLFDEVWTDVVVGDDALTMAVSKLRRALGDERRGGPYIETIPKTGYRLVAPVKQVEPDASRERTAAFEPEATPDSPQLARRRRWWLLALLASAALLTLAWVGLQVDRGKQHAPASVAEAPRESILTSMPGSELLGRLSPDGEWVVYARQGGSNPGLFVQRRHRGVPKRLVAGKDQIAASDFSPDGRRIATLDCRNGAHGVYCDLLLVELEDGAVELVLSFRASPMQGLAWSPDGDEVVIARSPAPGKSFSLTAVELSTGALRPITEPPEGQIGDARPAFSPNGRRLAFTRGPDLFRRDLYVADADGGSPRRLDVAASRVWGLTWSADGRGLVFSSNREGPFRLYRVGIETSAVQWIPTSAHEVRFPWIAGDRLLFESFTLDTDLWRLGPEDTFERMEALTSTRWDMAPRHAPDGVRLAFVTMRSGSPEIWLSSPDGLEQLVAPPTYYLGPLEWSPDGQYLIAADTFGETSSLFLVNVEAATLKRIPFPADTVRSPSWSRDGCKLYVASDRGGSWRIWRLPLEPGAPDGPTTGSPVAITEGFSAFESFDGAGLFVMLVDGQIVYWPLDAAGLPVAEEPIPVVDDLAAGQGLNWIVVEGGLLYPANVNGGLALVALDTATGVRRNVAALDRYPFGPGVSATRDGTDIVVAWREPMESELRLVDDFR